VSCARSVTILVAGIIALPVGVLRAQARPDFSGVWRLDPLQSRMIGADVRADSATDHQITWLVDHRDPEISVVVDVRDSHGSHEWSFKCTTDGRVCVNELPDLHEVRRISAVWHNDVLVMTQIAETPHGGFEATDRLYTSGERLVFDRKLRDARGERSVRQVFRKVGPHPTRPLDRRGALPSAVPSELDRVPRDHEQLSQAGNADTFAGLSRKTPSLARASERGRVVAHAANLRSSVRTAQGDPYRIAESRTS
jgi:hypothetical protein